MEKDQPDTDIIHDYITGKPTPIVGAEENRQAVERFLVNEKGYAKEDINVDEKLTIHVNEEVYTSRIDLVVYVNNKRFMVIKCAPGSLGSREREVLAAARLMPEGPVPFAVVSDGKTAIILDTISGKTINEGLSALWSKEETQKVLQIIHTDPLSKEKQEKEALIFRSYDSMNVNKLGSS